MSYITFRVLSIAFFVMALILLIVSAVMFYRYDIRSTIRILSGKKLSKRAENISKEKQTKWSAKIRNEETKLLLEEEAVETMLLSGNVDEETLMLTSKEGACTAILTNGENEDTVVLNDEENETMLLENCSGERETPVFEITENIIVTNNSEIGGVT